MVRTIALIEGKEGPALNRTFVRSGRADRAKELVDLHLQPVAVR